MSSKAKIGDQVTVAVTVKLDDGTIALKSTREQPLRFELDPKKTIPGFAEALVGMAEGETKFAQIPPEKGFGIYDAQKRVYVERRNLDRNQTYSVGDEVALRSPGYGGREIHGWIEELDKDEVVINRNHRLAGKILSLNIELLQIR